VWQDLNQALIHRNISLIGNILDSNPGLEHSIINYFTKNISESDLKRGLSIARKYGYTPDIPLNLSPLIPQYHLKSTTIILVFSFVQIALLIFILLVLFSRLYKQMNTLCLGAEKIMNGSFDIKLPEDGEGILPNLGFQFNQMSNRLKHTLDALKSEKVMLKNIISDISHQLKTPLSSLYVFNELLLDGATEQEDVRNEFLIKSKVQLERMEWLIQALLKISRLEAGVIQFNRKYEDLCFMINNIVNSLEFKWKEKNHSIQIIKNLAEEGKDFVYLSYDPEWLGEAVENIIKNAIEYTPVGGKIDIIVEEKESLVTLIIKDSGIGIPQEDLPYIFNRFYQGRNSKKGTGIGLSLSRLIVEKHGGVINVSSRKNQGTTFTITFPKSLLRT